MQFKKQLMGFVGAFSLISSALYGFGLQLGPFDLELGRYRSDPPQSQRVAAVAVSYDPICTAIARRQQLEMTVEWREKISDTEYKVTVKRVTVEPYLFGKKKDGQLILRGNVVAERLQKEVSLKYGDGYDQRWDTGHFVPNDESAYTGTYSSKDGKGVNTMGFERISEIRVLDQGFEPPKDFNDVFRDDVAVVICTVTSSPSDVKR